MGTKAPPTTSDKQYDKNIPAGAAIVRLLDGWRTTASGENSPITAPWRQTVGAEFGNARWVRTLQLAFNKSTSSSTLELWLWQLALADYTVRAHEELQTYVLTPTAAQAEKLVTPTNPRALGATQGEEKRFGVVEDTEVGVKRWEAKLKQALPSHRTPDGRLPPILMFPLTAQTESQEAAPTPREEVTIVVLDWKQLEEGGVE